MCGRFASDFPSHALAALFDVVGALPNAPPSYNVAPTQGVPVVRRHPGTGERRLDLLRWGLDPNWSTDKGRQPINARAETVDTARMFRGAMASRRCIVPARVFYEWRQGSRPKQPFAFGRRDKDALALAGLWEKWTDQDGELLRSFAIITTSASAMLRTIHDRMPVVLERADWAAWLAEGPVGLLRPAADDVLIRWPVSSRVNSPRHDDATLLEEQARPGPEDQDAGGPDSA